MTAPTSLSFGPPRARRWRFQSRGPKRLSSGTSRSGCHTGCSCRMMSLKDDSEQEAMAVDVAVLVFEKMFEKIVRSHRRFNVNMARIGGLMKLVTSDEGQFKSTAFMHYEGVSADILRLIVVFLHA